MLLFPAARLPPHEGVPAGRARTSPTGTAAGGRHTAGVPAASPLGSSFPLRVQQGCRGGQHLPLGRLERPVRAQHTSKVCHSSADQTFTEQVTPEEEGKPVYGHPMLGKDQYQGPQWRRSSLRAHADTRCAATDHLDGRSPSIRTSISQCTPDSSEATWSSQERPEEHFGVGSNQRGCRQQPACFLEQVFCSSESLPPRLP